MINLIQNYTIRVIPYINATSINIFPIGILGDFLHKGILLFSSPIFFLVAQQYVCHSKLIGGSTGRSFLQKLSPVSWLY
jgi:hypothetical protein